MSTEDTDKPLSSQIERLNEKNYRSWSTQVRALLRHQKVLDVVESVNGVSPKPILTPAGAQPTKDETEAHKKLIDVWETKAARACAILLPTISGRLMTYVEDEDDPARIWTILRDRFRPTTDVTLAQALKHIVTLRMADDGDMEAHIRDFTASKRRVEEHGVALTDIVYRTFFLISMPTTYQMTVTAIESQSSVTLEVAQNRLLEEWRKRKGQPKGGLMMTALHTHKGRHKAGNSSGKSSLLCTHCQKKGHVESTCWRKYPHLKDKSTAAAASEARVAFQGTTKTAGKAHIGENDGNSEHWIIDSGASEHFSPYKHILTNYKSLDEAVEVNTAKGKLFGIGTGSVNLTAEGQDGLTPITLHHVLHVPGMDSNLLSSNVLLDKGFEISMHPTRGTNILLGDYIVAKTIPYGKLWRLKTVKGRNDSEHALKMVGPKPKEPQLPKILPYDIWHRRFAHLGPWNLQKVEKLVEGMAIDPATIPKKGYDCEACISGSQTRNFSDAPMAKRKEPGDRIHSDICGWIDPISIGGSRYFLTFIDDATRMTYLFVLKSKTAKEVRECFLEFRNVFEQDGRRIKSIRTDGGGEYRKQMAELCKETGIHHEETAPYTPEQNGVAKRANRTICERIRAILADTGLPKELWAELARTVAHVKNRSPTTALNNRTPYEALYGQRPDVSHLVAIGTKAFVHMPKKKTKKLDPRNFEGIMVGYGESNQYRIWIPGTNKVRVSRDVRFVGETRRMVEAVGSGPGAPPTPPGVEEKVVYDMIEVLPAPEEPARNSEDESDEESEREDKNGDSSNSGSDSDKSSEDDNHESNIYGGPMVESEDLISATTSPTVPSKFRNLNEPRTQRVRKPRPAPFDPSQYVSAQHEAQAQSHVAFKADTTMWSESSGDIEPQSYEEAVNHPVYGKEWRAAIEEEYNSLMKNGAWELVELPPGKNLVTCKWVFKAKHDANGNIVRFKARLVARSFSQAYGIDYFETFAPVAKLTTYRTIFALAALEKWEIHGMDVITAYLLGKLKEEIYMTQLEGFVRTGIKRNLVCQLLRSLYGLKQAARVWNLKIHAFLIKIGFVRSHADPCLYINIKLGIYITIWVDDLLIAGKDGKQIADVKRQLASEFEMKDLGELKHFLGMRIARTLNGDITIDQNGYIRQILERFGMQDSKSVSTPFATGSRLVSANHTGTTSPTTTDIKEYQAMVGSLMYAMLCTRPDLAYAIQQLSQFSSNPTNAHFQAAKRVFRYLQGTQTTGLIYGGNHNEITKRVQGYCDADYAADSDRKSISGYVFTLGGSPISWQAKKQTTVAQSTVEAEYAAMAHAAKEAIWLKYLLQDLGMSKYEPTILFCDNQGAISLAKNPTHHAKTKHVDVQLHFIRDHVEKGTINIEYCPTEDMLADLMTKGLAKDRHAGLMELMGVGTCEIMGNTTPSSSEVKEGHSTGSTSGSVELRGIRTVPAGDQRGDQRGNQRGK